VEQGVRKAYGDYGNSNNSGQIDGPGVGNKRTDAEWREMGFAKALPILTGLLGEEGFMRELKRVCHTFREALATLFVANNSTA